MEELAITPLRMSEEELKAYFSGAQDITRYLIEKMDSIDGTWLTDWSEQPIVYSQRQIRDNGGIGLVFYDGLVPYVLCTPLGTLKVGTVGGDRYSQEGIKSLVEERLKLELYAEDKGGSGEFIYSVVCDLEGRVLPQIVMLVEGSYLPREVVARLWNVVKPEGRNALG